MKINLLVFVECFETGFHVWRKTAVVDVDHGWMFLIQQFNQLSFVWGGGDQVTAALFGHSSGIEDQGTRQNLSARLE